MITMTTQKLMGIGLFLLAVFAAVPVLIAVSGRWDFYYTLTSVALLSVASAGVWLTFYIGRINIGPVSYTHLDVYKRQPSRTASSRRSSSRRLTDLS